MEDVFHVVWEFSEQDVRPKALTDVGGRDGPDSRGGQDAGYDSVNMC